ncbi:HAD-IA family hydrolase [Pediococcus acidilactici]|uniref:HAD-IA family hydrolase n=1 Tax=Pediococcus acidilactici TaxID=1254 RepID=A0AAW8YEL2_PEDAC|nr:HAD-IA family hydrolase [Pediococcus acidilactici]GAC45128.1 P-Ser-HPr phosphatase [Pediococcus acidilactici NGRI 0510Q]KRN91631.1 P-Ser-HPr phosphatase [Pediococcus acidilactici]MDD9323258.1 HAD-IA family hydrolase [Pediococcus acidilactici]MDV2602641.1 HAD-IA family hydrolase [Pediococcus acidilactici]MDV2620544.1 HAD-IA family hydrolase [Pediococcus acidilactici]
MDIFYDFDGTLFNTYPVMVAAFVDAAQQAGVTVNPHLVYEQMRQHSLGFAIKTTAKANGLDTNQFKRVFREIETPRLIEAQPFSDVKELLAQITAQGGHNFLLTHRNQAAIDLLQKYGLRDYFTDFVTGDQDFPRKPNPASLNYLITKHHVNQKAAYMIGDRNLDIDAAHHAAIKGILFDPDQLIDVTSAPEFTTTNFAAIRDYLAK